MATNHNPDFVQELMFEDFGTKVLITDPAADRYLEEYTKNQLKKRMAKEWFEGDD